MHIRTIVHISILIFLLLGTSSPRKLPRISCIFDSCFLSSPSEPSFYGLRLEDMDQRVNPAKDFYRFANGNYKRNSPILSKQDEVTPTGKLHTQSVARLLSILQNLSQNIYNFEFYSTEAKLGRFWNSVLDENALEKARESAEVVLFEMIDEITSVSEYMRILGKLHQYGIPVLFIPEITYENGTYKVSLVSSDFMIDTNNFEEKVRKILSSCGKSEVDVEVVINAVAHVERGLSTKKIKTESINWGVPKGWLTYAKVIGLNESQWENVGTHFPEYFQYLLDDISETNLKEYKEYMKFQAMHQMRDFLSSDLNDAPDFKNGIIEEISDFIPQMLSKVYCETYHDEMTQLKIVEMVNNLKQAFENILHGVKWMSRRTKRMALRKLQAMDSKIGCPKEFIYLEKVHFGPDASFFDHILEMRKAFVVELMSLVGLEKALDRYVPPPYEATGFYDMSKNQFVIPTALLQPPYFDLNRDDAVNYGAIGAVIAHEMTHGFDDYGWKLDHQGVPVGCILKEDCVKFEEIAKKAITQYNSQRVVKHAVNGSLTLGENLADIGGLKIAYDALQHFFALKGRAPILDGFTPEQRFFISFAQLYARNIKKQRKLELLETDEHSPHKIRAMCVPPNLDEFYQAFRVKSSDPMYFRPEDRIKLWDHE